MAHILQIAFMIHPEFHIVKGDLEEILFTVDRADDALNQANVLYRTGATKVAIKDVFDRVFTLKEFEELFVAPWRRHK